MPKTLPALVPKLGFALAFLLILASGWGLLALSEWLAPATPAELQALRP